MSLKKAINKKIITYKDFISMVIKGDALSIVCKSKTGLGKTFITIELLKELNTEYNYQSGYTTPLRLYQTLYDNKDNILVLDDMEKLFTNDIAIDLLRSALWEVDGKRKICYKTTSERLGDYPDEFFYNGKIIWLLNTIKGKQDESLNALISRTISYDFVYSYDELMEMTNKILDIKPISEQTKRDVKTIIKNNITKATPYNFRVLDRIIAFVNYDREKAEHLFLASSKKNEDLEIVLNIVNKAMKSNMGVEQQVNEFRRLTGKSRITFFRLKKEMREIYRG